MLFFKRRNPYADDMEVYTITDKVFPLTTEFGVDWARKRLLVPYGRINNDHPIPPELTDREEVLRYAETLFRLHGDERAKANS